MAPSDVDITTNCTLPAFDALAIPVADLPEEATVSVHPRPGRITLIATLRPRQTGADSRGRLPCDGSLKWPLVTMSALQAGIPIRNHLRGGALADSIRIIGNAAQQRAIILRPAPRSQTIGNHSCPAVAVCASPSWLQPEKHIRDCHCGALFAFGRMGNISAIWTANVPRRMWYLPSRVIHRRALICNRADSQMQSKSECHAMPCGRPPR